MEKDKKIATSKVLVVMLLILVMGLAVFIGLWATRGSPEQKRKVTVTVTEKKRIVSVREVKQERRERIQKRREVKRERLKGTSFGEKRSVKKLSNAWVVWIGPGSFYMGSPGDEPGRYKREEGPQTHVTLSRGFWMWRTEVTQGHFSELMGYNPSYFSNCGTNCPVETVNWHEAALFCNRLSSRQGLESCFNCRGSGASARCAVKFKYSGGNHHRCNGWRLPTEAEWEYAARAGTRSAIYSGTFKILGEHNAPALDGISWYGGNSGVNYSGAKNCSGKKWKERQYTNSNRCGTHPVARKRPNQWGLYDMLGNVWEWCLNWNYKYPGGHVTDPGGPSHGFKKVHRGGAWKSQVRAVRAANRYPGKPNKSSLSVGFRCVR